jgi:SAM-dependent methyltransferase
VLFTDWLVSHDIPAGKAVDIGAGKGRNSIHLAKCGYEVWALEYIEPAIEVAEALAIQNGVQKSIHFEQVCIDEKWQFTDSFFVVAVDSFSSIDVETEEGRKTCRDEMFRTLKPGGYALVNVVSSEDEWEKEMIKNNPGPEKNSVIWPENGKFQKNYDEAELREFYSNFEIIDVRTIQKPAFKLGREGIATNLWMLLRKG